MKEIKAKESFYLEEYDVHVVPYLTTEQIQNIATETIKYQTWGEREEVKRYMTLCYVTDIGEEEINKLNPDLIEQSGLWDRVWHNIENYHDIEDAIEYEESFIKQIGIILEQLPEIAREAVAETKK